MYQKSKQIITCGLLVIFTCYYVNICFFYHSHIINGTTIVHSHFHNKAHTQTGTHGGSEITLIAALSVFQSLQAASSIAETGLFFILLTIMLPLSEKRISRNLISSIPLRAPPFLR
ncbi:MAG: hypothetical protein LBH90_02555 [Tannerella sp.]|jgi:hypothetical protein|nr:hypothetical protein [Tannerella sp.]